MHITVGLIISHYGSKNLWVLSNLANGNTRFLALCEYGALLHLLLLNGFFPTLNNILKCKCWSELRSILEQGPLQLCSIQISENTFYFRAKEPKNFLALSNTSALYYC